jgi:hypothetical protein
MLHRCSFKGCPKTVEYPQTFFLPPSGWAHFGDGWGPGIPEGLYCQAHGEALEQLEMNGDLDNPTETDEDIMGNHLASFWEWLVEHHADEDATLRVADAVFHVAARRQDLVEAEDWVALVKLAQHPTLNN